VPAQKKVSVLWQIIFTYVPILDLWAFYRIKKLRKLVLYVMLPSVIFGFVIGVSLGDGLGNGSHKVFGLYIAGIGFLVLTNFLMIRWSRQHNRQFDQPATQAEAP